MQKATADAPAYNQHGALLIKTSITTEGAISLYVTAGAGRIDALSKAFTDRTAAAAWYRHIAQAAEQGKPIHQIEAEIAALIEAGQAVEQVTTSALAALRQEQPDVRPTMAGAHRKPPTCPQVRAARSHRNGVIYVQPGVSRATLRSMARKGYGTPRYSGRRYELVALELNERGLRLAEVPA
jgi:hypothetical protein